MEVVTSLSQGHTAAAQCDLFTHKSVPVIFEPPCIIVTINQANANSFLLIYQYYNLLFIKSNYTYILDSKTCKYGDNKLGLHKRQFFSILDTCLYRYKAACMCYWKTAVLISSCQVL